MANAYLEIAREVLLATRVPMNAREIVRYAHSHRLFPVHLYGQRQDRTLQARLSEDIRTWGTKSAFFRTDPGEYFLWELSHLLNLPGRRRLPFDARPRVLDLSSSSVLSVTRDVVDSFLPEGISRNVSNLISAIAAADPRFLPLRTVMQDRNLVRITSYVIVTRGEYVLTYRKGRYRGGDESLYQKRSIGFDNPVTAQDYDLFDRSNIGIINSGIRQVQTVLGYTSHTSKENEIALELAAALRFRQDSVDNEILMVVAFDCPPNFEPTSRRLSINDLRWMHVLDRMNAPEDFEPVGRLLLDYGLPQELALGHLAT